jgi:hypothetical protein
MENYKQWMEQKLTSEDMDKLPKVIKPLTQEQIKTRISCTEQMGIQVDNDGYETDIVNLIRSVEKAHGIV